MGDPIELQLLAQQGNEDGLGMMFGAGEAARENKSLIADDAINSIQGVTGTGILLRAGTCSLRSSRSLWARISWGRAFPTENGKWSRIKGDYSTPR